MATSWILTVNILLWSPDNRSLDACLGNFERHFSETIGNLPCSIGSNWQKNICKGSILLHTVLSSNIPEAFLLYKCFEFIKKQTEKSHELIGEEKYRIRKKDNGIVISISIVQWGIEVVNTIMYFCYVHYLHGISNYADKLFNLYLITFIVIIQPSFYLNGDPEFRRNLANNGILATIKSYL